MLNADKYNYSRFKPAYYDFTKFEGPKAGEKYLDFKALTLEGKGVRLSDFIGKTIVIETGSVTCPNYVQDIMPMQELVNKYPHVQFIVLYIREAHPGNETPRHSNKQEKIRQAKRLYEEYPENRLILVDDLKGTAHQKYGGMPNMVYVLNEQGTVIFRGDWNHVETLSETLKEENQKHLFYQEHFEPAAPKLWTTIQVLLKGGWDALWDMAFALPVLRKLHQKANLAYMNKRAV